MKLVLHNYWRSSTSHRVRIALGLKGLAYEYVAVNILHDRQHAEPYRAKNPSAQVPLLEITEDDGTTRALTQSLAIIEYLEERFAAPAHAALLPRDLWQRARARALAEIVNSGIQPHQNLATLRKLKAAGVDDAAWAKGFIVEGLAAFAHAAAATAGAFCVGDAPSIADCCLIPQLASARRFHHVVPYPALLAIEERCLALPAFAAAMPDLQPDAVRS
ncbi:MAG: maleylacetoacetate isomerase [Myxococcota bacterium]|nr:maleylacetoacetate isomerase [Myxococcota bacterium]